MNSPWGRMSSYPTTDVLTDQQIQTLEGAIWKRSRHGGCGHQPSNAWTPEAGRGRSTLPKQSYDTLTLGSGLQNGQNSYCFKPWSVGLYYSCRKTLTPFTSPPGQLCLLGTPTQASQGQISSDADLCSRAGIETQHGGPRQPLHSQKPPRVQLWPAASWGQHLRATHTGQCSPSPCAFQANNSCLTL